MMQAEIIPGTELVEFMGADNIYVRPPIGTGVPDVRWNLAAIARLQRTSGAALRELVTRAREEGLSWSVIAQDLGMPHSTLLRQYKAGKSINVSAEEE